MANDKETYSENKKTSSVFKKWHCLLFIGFFLGTAALDLFVLKPDKTLSGEWFVEFISVRGPGLMPLLLMFAVCGSYLILSVEWTEQRIKKALNIIDSVEPSNHYFSGVLIILAGFVVAVFSMIKYGRLAGYPPLMLAVGVALWLICRRLAWRHYNVPSFGKHKGQIK
ncbi:MAG: hypothetical protein C9356_19785 [Oleiphilus sp.]|nr:MAG: hypothetical protein C9356_19785 [Oleiphilus sp.]